MLKNYDSLKECAHCSAYCLGAVTWLYSAEGITWFFCSRDHREAWKREHAAH